MNFRQFWDLQGCNYVVIRRDSMTERIIFANGATSNGQWEHYAPPTDKKALLELLHEYHQEKLRRAELDFNRLKAAIIEGGTYNWPVKVYGPQPADRIVALQLLRTVVLEQREALAANIAEQERLPECLVLEKKRRLRERAEALGSRECDEACRLALAIQI